MLILGIESATPVASVALVDEKGLLGEINLNLGLTHSEQLLPTIDSLLKQCRRTIKEVTAVAVSAGPGSFTGLRIGMATAKGLAQGGGLKLLAVPTLEAMARQLMGLGYLVGPMQNARRNQVYAGLYRWSADSLFTFVQERRPGKKERSYADNGVVPWQLECLIQPAAWSVEEWAAQVEPFCWQTGRQAAFLGDGATAYQADWQRLLDEQAVILPPVLSLPRASYVALAAQERLERGQSDRLFDAGLIYIRGI
ncbi:MAG: tRNA (adenosine(37)-N6)-threonylcarbamoyltransferase complex dimerization subunit type 1 TsaB [Peptococcaceae bacterium]|nr:tRNA (adenosine(37)-N6)-threonylcarbamoyltransferase complex dimerization subunit type 1 TsaB [Peptococcaceae bacterium]